MHKVLSSKELSPDEQILEKNALEIKCQLITQRGDRELKKIRNPAFQALVVGKERKSLESERPHPQKVHENKTKLNVLTHNARSLLYFSRQLRFANTIKQNNCKKSVSPKHGSPRTYRTTHCSSNYTIYCKDKQTVDYNSKQGEVLIAMKNLAILIETEI